MLPESLSDAISNRADSPIWRRDGNTSFASGVDASIPANEIQRDQVEKAVNATFRRGPASPRPAFRKRALTFASNDVQAGFVQPEGPLQHAAKFDGAGVPCLMSSQAGRQFMINLRTFMVQEITPKELDGSPDVNSPTLPIGWSEQVENYWVFQDNQSKAIIFNGSGSRRSDPSKSEVPTGNVMCYQQGRLAVALPDRTTFRIGDIVFGASGTAANNYRDAELKFTENNYQNEGGDFVARVFGAPSKFGFITSMKAAAMTDTQLGQGPLIVGQQYMVFTVQLPYDRTTWKNLANALQTANPILGPLGQDSTVLVNNDLWYRSIDGIRSYLMAQRQFNQEPGNTPNSAELGDLLDFDTPELLEFGSAVLFSNRLLMTVSPVNSQWGVYHRGLVALDFNLVSSIRHKTAPAWEGIWSGGGIKILKIVVATIDNRERCFMYVLGCNNQIELWEIDPTQKTDEGNVDIVWSLDLPSYNCGDSNNFKMLETGRLIFTEMSGTLKGTVKYRTNESVCYQPWDTFTECAANQDCGPPDCAGPHTYREQKRFPIRLHAPPDDFDPESGESYRTGYEFQPRIELEGWGQLKEFRLFAKDKTETLGVTKAT